jgi:hypothetical protein
MDKKLALLPSLVKKKNQGYSKMEKFMEMGR